MVKGSLPVMRYTMYNRFIIVSFQVIFLLVLNIRPVIAQFPSASKKWAIADCFQYAAAHNIQINTLRLNELSARQDLLVAEAAKIPALSASAGNTFNNANNIVAGNNSRLINQLSAIGNYSVNSSVILWNNNSVGNKIREQHLLTESAGLAVQETQNNIIILITQAYLNILLSRENEKYIIDLVSASAESVNQGQMLFDAGSISKINLMQLQAQLAGDKYLLVQTQNQVRQNVLSLEQLLQLPADTLFDIVTPLHVEAKEILPTLAEAEQAALKSFPEIKIGRLNTEIASLNILLAKAAYKPTVKATAAMGSGYSDVIINNVSPKTAYLIQTGNNFYQSLGITVAIPIFSQRVNRAGVEKSFIAYKQAGLNLQNIQLVLLQVVERAYLNALNAQQAFDAANQQLVTATESYNIANEQLKLGAINSYNLLLQRNQYVQAVQAYTEAKYTTVLQQKIYQFYMGSPIIL
ncbi:TolC family protein [Ferruginibacter paludis]|uniref:TolC family protein n=1 Tax=Ferruginibacter paludis TaxID=1310417 RepID=UPI0025B3BA34|nr:TolC family protein [Ferruginibacter paludis]MDN3659224.1 TolC family protein [Ferruginibacter paludis]